jgi:excinuclease ABC subunit B
VNENGLVVSESMRKAINLTNYRRNLQNKYNKENGIIPKTIFSSIKDI